MVTKMKNIHAPSPIILDLEVRCAGPEACVVEFSSARWDSSNKSLC